MGEGREAAPVRYPWAAAGPAFLLRSVGNPGELERSRASFPQLPGGEAIRRTFSPGWRLERVMPTAGMGFRTGYVRLAAGSGEPDFAAGRANPFRVADSLGDPGRGRPQDSENRRHDDRNRQHAERDPFSVCVRDIRIRHHRRPPIRPNRVFPPNAGREQAQVGTGEGSHVPSPTIERAISSFMISFVPP